MKRLNVREFRKNVSTLTNEPIEVVRYSETIGFWIPQGLTLEPRKGSGKKVPPLGWTSTDLERAVKRIRERMGVLDGET